MARRAPERRGRAGSGRSRPWLWYILGGIVVVLVAVFVYRLTNGQSATTTSGTVGTSVPDLTLPSTAGHPISLTGYRGKKLAVYFYEGSG